MMGKVYGLTTTRVYNVMEKYHFVKVPHFTRTFFSTKFRIFAHSFRSKKQISTKKFAKSFAHFFRESLFLLETLITARI